VKVAEHVSDLIERDKEGRHRIFSSKPGVRELDMEEEDIAMFGGRYRLPVGAFGEDKAIADDDDGAVCFGEPWAACGVVADDFSRNW
jgi:hypothetical protein